MLQLVQVDENDKKNVGINSYENNNNINFDEDENKKNKKEKEDNQPKITKSYRINKDNEKA